jgi:hypothetical protein
MDEPSSAGPRGVPLDRLRRAFAKAPSGSPVADSSVIDRSRPFLCASVVPMGYTSAYQRLTPPQALRANQISGLCFNELITFFEAAFAPALLAALRRRRVPEDLAACLEHFLADEARHSRMFQRLNRLSAPGWYERGPFHVVHIPRRVRLAVAALARHPGAFPAVLFLMLALEEHSIEVSRRCVAARAGIEPHWAETYRAHLEDEVRHVQVDWHLIESAAAWAASGSCCGCRARWTRWGTRSSRSS